MSVHLSSALNLSSILSPPIQSQSQDVQFSTAIRFGENQPQQVAEMIESRFFEISRKTTMPVIGQENYNFVLPFDAHSLINLFADYHTSKPLLILDIGTGNGLFLDEISRIFGNRIIAMGLSAADYRTSSSKWPDENYVVGNAETMIKKGLFEKSHFHLIFSSLTFLYFVDPLSALCQVYERLQPGGVLCVDGITLLGLNGYLLKLVDYLNSAGYQIAAAFTGADNREGNISSLVIQKTHPHLNLPVIYDDQPIVPGDNKCRYKIDHRFIPIIPEGELDIEHPKSQTSSRMLKINVNDWLNVINKFPQAPKGFMKIFKDKILGLAETTSNRI